MNHVRSCGTGREAEMKRHPRGITVGELCGLCHVSALCVSVNVKSFVSFVESENYILKVKINKNYQLLVRTWTGMFHDTFLRQEQGEEATPASHDVFHDRYVCVLVRAQGKGPRYVSRYVRCLFVQIPVSPNWDDMFHDMFVH